MADNIANILMRLRGEDDDASNTLESFLGKLKAFGNTEATAEADVATGAAASKLAALEAALLRLSRRRAVATASVEVKRDALDNLTESLRTQEGLILPVGVQPTQARRQMAQALAELEATAKASDVEVPLKITGSLSELAKMRAAIQAFGQTAQGLNVRIIPQVETTAASTKLALLAAQLRKFDQSEAIAEAKIEPTIGNLSAAFKKFNQEAEKRELVLPVGVDDDRLAFNMQRALAGLSGIIASRNLEIEPKLKTENLHAELAALNATMRTFADNKIDIDVDVNKVSLASMLMTKLASSMAQGSAAASRMGQSMGGVTVNFGMFGLKLTPLVGVVLALAVAMGVSLVAALGLLVSSLAAATAAVGALAAAFAGALGPIVAVAGATIARVTKVVQALKAKTTAEKQGAAGSAQSVALEERRRDALAQVGSALRGVTSAERGLRQAREAARDAIVQANREEQAAAEALALASQDTARTMVEGFKAIADAAEDARDALLDVEQAKLGIESAEIATQRAQIALQKFRNESKLSGAELSKSFDKFTDVDFDFDVSSVDKILTGAGAGKTAQENALELKERILDVRQAKLNEKKATDTLSDSERALTEKRRLAAKYAREGIAAYEPYTAAVRAQRDATVRLADATARSNELERQGIAGAPGVIAAQEALVNAQHGLTEARRNSANAAKAAAGGEAARKAKADWEALTQAEQIFALALKNTGDSLKTTFGPAVEGMLRGLTTAMTTLPTILAPLENAFRGLGNAMGDVIADFAFQLSQPAMSEAFVKLIEGATELVRVLGGRGWQAFFEIMTNLAVAAMPLLIASSKIFVGWLERIAGRTRDPEKMGRAMASLGEHFFGILGLVKQVARIFINFFKATSGQAKGFVGTLTSMAKGVADFLGSAEGQKQLQEFFKAVIPLAIETFKFIGNVILFILQAVETVAPALTGVLRVFNFLFGVVNRVVGALKPFLKIAAQIALLFVGGLPFAIGRFLAKFRLLAPIGRFLTKHIVGVVTAIIGRISAIASFFPKVFDTVQDHVLDFISWIGKQFGRVVRLITWPFRQAIDFIEKLAGRFWEAGKGIIEAIIEGMRSLINEIGGLAGKVFKFLVDKLPGSEPKDKSSPLVGLAERGRAIMENIAKGVPLGADQLTGAIHRSLVPVVAGIDTSVTIPRSKSPVGVGAGAVGAGGTVFHNTFQIEAPAGALPDAEATAVALARRLERRAGGSPRQ